MQTWMKALAGAVTMTALVTACGPAEADENDDVATAEDALSTRTAGYVTLRRDQRRCVSPMCGGYFVKDFVNGGAEQYVSGLDFTRSGLDDDAQGDVFEAPDGEAIVKGKLGVQEPRFKTRALVVSDAWRGMPGKTVAAGDRFYVTSARSPAITCKAAPCHNLAATLAGRTAKTFYTTLDTGPALPSFSSRSWLDSRVLEHGAIVAAHFRNGDRQPAGFEKVLEVSQVFVKLPEAIGPCPAFKLRACPSGQVWSYTRNENRCAMPTSCVPQRACTRMLPRCADGYTARFWSENGCNVVACDPAWSVPEVQ